MCSIISIMNNSYCSINILSSFLIILLPDHTAKVHSFFVPRPEIIRPAFYIEVFSAIPERVRVGAATVFLVAEGVVVVGFRLRSGGAAGSPRAAMPPGVIRTNSQRSISGHRDLFAVDPDRIMLRDRLKIGYRMNLHRRLMIYIKL